MEIAEGVWKFYQNVVELLQKDYGSANNFVEQAATSMLCGMEFGGTALNSIESYETSFIWNLTYNNENNKELNTILAPFSIINQDGYFNELITSNPLLAREILMICQLSNELETNKSDSLAAKLLDLKKSKLPEAYHSFSTMKEITRTGWIVRNIPKTHQENDAIHIMQMFALALAYFRLDKNIDLDQKKVYETILLHEIGETLAGDIREGIAEHETKHDLERQAVKKTFTSLNKGLYFIDLWDEFEERKTKEAEFVYQLDKIDPILKAQILDKYLARGDLFEDFYSYEEKRKTFEKGKVKELFYYSKKVGGRKI